MQPDQYLSGSRLLSRRTSGVCAVCLSNILHGTDRILFFRTGDLHQKQKWLSLSGQQSGLQCTGSSGTGSAVSKSENQAAGKCKRDRTRKAGWILDRKNKNLAIRGGCCDHRLRFSCFGNRRRREAMFLPDVLDTKSSNRSLHWFRWSARAISFPNGQG